jgi:hypothetical protein
MSSKSGYSPSHWSMASASELIAHWRGILRRWFVGFALTVRTGLQTLAGEQADYLAASRRPCLDHLPGCAAPRADGGQHRLYGSGDQMNAARSAMLEQGGPALGSLEACHRMVGQFGRRAADVPPPEVIGHHLGSWVGHPEPTQLRIGGRFQRRSDAKRAGRNHEW